MAKAKELPGKGTRPPMELTVGNTYYIRTARNDYVGRLESICGPYTIVLAEASWVANSGRLSDFMRDGQAEGMEIEPLYQSRTMLQWQEITEWPHELFTEAI